MAIIYRRSLKVRQDEVLFREAAILRVARKLLKRQGYIGLTMDRVATSAGISKATLYRHFTSKEEVIMGLAVENARQRVAYTERATTFAGHAREQFVAVRVFAERIYPSHLEVELILYTTAIRAKTSPEWQEALAAEETEVFRLMTQIVQHAIDRHELKLPSTARPEDVAFSVWSLFFGGFALRMAGIPLDRCMGERASAGQDFLVSYGSAALDGLGWRPLSTDWNYAETQKRVEKTFANELKL